MTSKDFFFFFVVFKIVYQENLFYQLVNIVIRVVTVPTYKMDEKINIAFASHGGN